MTLPDPAGLALPELGGRLRLVGQLPTTVAALVVLAVVLSGAPGSDPSWSRLAASVTDLTAEQVAWLAVGIAVLTVLLHPLQRGLVRLLEGYPLLHGPGSLLGRLLRKRWERRFDRLSAAQVRQLDPGSGGPPPAGERGTGEGIAGEGMTSEGAAGEGVVGRRQAEAAMLRAAVQLRQLPARDRLMPTRLGNVLRAAEDEAGIRYGVDTVTLWPMLYPLVSDRLAAGLQDARDRLDTAARFAGTLVLTALVCAGLLIGSWWAFPVVAALLLLAVLSYRGAVAAASGYGELINAAIALHRFDLLKALHLPLPATPDEERATYQRLLRLLRNRLPDPTATFEHPD